MNISAFTRCLDIVTSLLLLALAPLLRLLPQRRIDYSGRAAQRLPRVGPFARELHVSRSCISKLPRSLTPWRQLRVLDLSGNNLKALPTCIADLHLLESLNLAHNSLNYLPAELGQLARLKVLGLRSNALQELPETFGNLQSLHSLFLTDNRLRALPRTLGKLTRLRKLQAASNRLETIPAELLEGALELEMLRVPCNNIETLPAAALSRHPKLCWLSLSGNPRWCDGPQECPHRDVPRLDPGDDLPVYDDTDAALGPSGASGGVYAATWRGDRVAVKRFVDGISPDGHPEDEIACARAVSNPCCVNILATAEQPTRVMVMSYIHGRPLGGRPNAASLLRCTYPSGTVWPAAVAITCAHDVARACAACAACRVSHGDVYAHNVVIDTSDGGHATLVDFGAAFAYNKACGVDFERLEVRAYGLLLQELAERCVGGCHKGMQDLATRCCDSDVASRPRFTDLEQALKRMRT